MSDQNKVYVIKKVKKIHKSGHHGGSWKIAYADFVTAMMSFFLLMWLLSLMNKSQLEAISAYFKRPLKAAFTETGAIHMNSQANKLAKPITPVKTTKLGDKNTGDKEYAFDTVNKSFQRLDQSNPLNRSAMSENLQKQLQTDQAKMAEMQARLMHLQKMIEMLKGMANTPSNATKLANLEKLEKTQQQAVSDLSDHMNEVKSSLDNVNQFEQLQQEIENKINSDPELAQYKNMLNFTITAEGLKINMHDLENKSMFTEGKTDFHKYASKLLKVLGETINHYPNQVEVIGHTDSLPYSDPNKYSNWELSADRANAARRALVDTGMDDQKIVRIIGVGDVDPLDKTNTKSPVNRRIEIIILSDEAMKKMAK